MKKKIIFDNIGYFIQKSGGLSTYWTELISRITKEKKYTLEFREPDIKCENIFRNSLQLSKIIKEKKIPLSILRYLPVFIIGKEKTIFHSSLYRIAFGKNVKNITIVHDFVYEYYRRGFPKLVHTLQKKIAVYFSDVVICISENTKKDLIKFFPWAKNKNIKVIYNGVSDDFYYLSNKNFKFDDFKLEKIIGMKYILYVGHRTNYKNFLLVAKTMINLKNEYKLIVVGEELNVEEKKVLNNGYDNYVYAGRASINDLNILYNYAHSFIYPSLYEGFGIPIIESMKTGCPVIATKLSCIPEVAGDAALYLENSTEEELEKKIRLLENKELREKLIKKGFDNTKRFSWDITYKEIEKIYSEI